MEVIDIQTQFDLGEPVYRIKRAGRWRLVKNGAKPVHRILIHAYAAKSGPTGRQVFVTEEYTMSSAEYAQLWRPQELFRTPEEAQAECDWRNEGGNHGGH